jgi:hypothetical protein
MSPPNHLRVVAENLWILEYPLNLLGGHQGRIVTIIRLNSGELIIHSTGPFTRAQVTEIEALGNPGWMTVVLHSPTRTLIVADLVFNFHPSTGWKSFFRSTLMGVKCHPDSARVYPLQIRDRKAYDRSLRELMAWDFDRIIVGHKEVVESNGKELLKQALANKGMFPGDAIEPLSH